MQEFYNYEIQGFDVYQTPNHWESLQNYNYILAKGDRAVVFDPGAVEPIENTLLKNRLQLEGIYLTHHHADHIGGVEYFRKKYSAKVVGYHGDSKQLPELDESFSDGSEFDILTCKVKAMHLPGHTTGLCAFFFTDQKWLFSGDLLFSLGCGRVDNNAYKDMFNSLKRVRDLPNETIVFSAHEYTLNNCNFSLEVLPGAKQYLELKIQLEKKYLEQTPSVPTTLEFEKEINVFLRWDDSFVKRAVGDEKLSDFQTFKILRELKNKF